MRSEETYGYTVGYEREELPFFLYALAFIAAAFLVAGTLRAIPALTLLALLPAAGVFYNLPLLDRDKPRLGASQYGFFLDGLGLVGWRAIDEIRLVPQEFRGTLYQQLSVTVRGPLDDALIVDWRRRPFPRSLMRKPWSLRQGRIIRVPLDIMDKPPAEIHAAVLRMWRYYRGSGV